MTSSNGNIFHVTGHLCGECTGPRWIPHTKASDAELWCFLWFYLHPNIRLSKQSRGWCFKTPSRPLWRHRNDYKAIQKKSISFLKSKLEHIDISDKSSQAYILIYLRGYEWNTYKYIEQAFIIMRKNCCQPPPPQIRSDKRIFLAKW